MAVLAPTEERKDSPRSCFGDCGAQFINFFGALTLERMRP